MVEQLRRGGVGSLLVLIGFVVAANSARAQSSGDCRDDDRYGASDDSSVIASKQIFIPLALEQEIAAESQILTALDTPVNMAFVEEPLTQVADAFSKAIGVNVVLDLRALDDTGTGSDTPVTRQLANISARSALKLILGSLDLTWMITDESLVITTPERAGSALLVRIYPVRDLVTVRLDGKIVTDYDALIDVITNVIQPTTWDEVGGPGTVSPFRSVGVIVCSQTRDVHEQVAQLLAGLRKAREGQGIPNIVSAPVRAQPEEPARATSRGPLVVNAQPAWRLPRRHDDEGRTVAAVPASNSRLSSQQGQGFF